MQMSSELWQYAGNLDDVGSGEVTHCHNIRHFAVDQVLAAIKAILLEASRHDPQESNRALLEKGAR